MRMRSLVISSIIWVALASPAFAKGSAASSEPTFGPEFEFTNDEIEDGDYGHDGSLHISDENLEYQEKWAEFWEKLCKKRKDCEVEETYESHYAYEHHGEINQDYYHPDYRIEFDDGFWFELTLDPTVVEVKTKPVTLEQALKFKDHFDDIFKTAKEVGLAPPKEHGGHISVGTKSAFGDDIKLYRNFMVEYALNHQELYVIMGNDFRNAPPIALLDESQQQAFLRIVSDIDANRIKDFATLKKRLKKDVYFKTHDPTVVSEWDRPEKYHAFNTTRLEKLTEFRGFPVQQNTNEFIALIRMLRASIVRLRSKKTKVQIEPFDYAGGNHAEWVARFEQFIDDIGESPADYYRFLKPKFRKHSGAEKCVRALKRREAEDNTAQKR